MIQDLYVKTYYKLIGAIFCLKPLRFIVRTLANHHLKYSFRYNTAKNKCSGKSEDVIVSLTSFPARINNLWIVVESLLRQSVSPQKIIIWLSKEQFTSQSIPLSLQKLESRGVEIRLVDGDIKSHKKYYYVFQEYPTSLVMLADDDIIYPSDLIESLLIARKSLNAKKVIAHKYGYRMKWDNNGHLLPYNNWGAFYSPYTGEDLFFGSGGGTLVRPSDFYKDVLNLDLALKLCPKADDVWLNAMARLGGCKYVKVQDGPILSIQNKEDVPLYKQNMRQGQNDVQLSAVSDYYIKTNNMNPFKINKSSITHNWKYFQDK